MDDKKADDQQPLMPTGQPVMMDPNMQQPMQYTQPQPYAPQPQAYPAPTGQAPYPVAAPMQQMPVQVGPDGQPIQYVMAPAQP